MFMGNRGILHDAAGQLGRARWRHPHWITCLTAFKGRQRPLMAPGRYTELFFLDEAVACAAGHRPCAECRRADWLLFRDLWARLFGAADAPTIDRALHRARLTPERRQRRYTAPAETLPEGAFVLWKDHPHLLSRWGLHRYAPAGYGPPLPRPDGPLTVITPEPLVQVMAAGWRPLLHPSASG
ncbi:hypothetical protein MASR2M74_35650 [Paracoccaceae bacterium]